MGDVVGFSESLQFAIRERHRTECPIPVDLHLVADDEDTGTRTTSHAIQNQSRRRLEWVLGIAAFLAPSPFSASDLGRESFESRLPQPLEALQPRIHGLQ